VGRGGVERGAEEGGGGGGGEMLEKPKKKRLTNKKGENFQRGVVRRKFFSSKKILGSRKVRAGRIGKNDCLTSRGQSEGKRRTKKNIQKTEPSSGQEKGPNCPLVLEVPGPDPLQRMGGRPRHTYCFEAGRRGDRGRRRDDQKVCQKQEERKYLMNPFRFDPKPSPRSRP